MSETLIYPPNGKEMSPSPLGRAKLTDLASVLNSEAPVVAVLEPGDATRYTLLIVPCWADSVKEGLSHYGIPPSEATNFLHVSKLSSYDSEGSFVRLDRKVRPDDLDDMSRNDWTKVLLSWWLNELRDLILEDRFPKEEVPEEIEGFIP